MGVLPHVAHPVEASGSVGSVVASLFVARSMECKKSESVGGGGGDNVLFVRAVAGVSVITFSSS